MKLSTIDKTRVATVDFGDDDTLNVTYSPAALTPRLESQLSDANTSEQMAHLVLSLVKDWDLVEENGEKVALELERLLDLPLIVLSTTVSAVARDIAKNVRAEGNS